MKEIIIPFTIGMTIFMLGMQMMRIGLNNLAQHKLKTVLTHFTSTPMRGFLTGTLLTMLLQSSAAVTLITIGLTNAGLLGFPQTIGIILGTNIGSTFTTQLLALNIYEYAVPLFITGAILWFIPHRTTRCIGLALAGFGCIFLGIDTLQTIAEPLRKTTAFQRLVTMGSENSVVGIIMGTIFSATIQSSTATTAITMSFMAEHIIPLTMAIAIVLGSNIGTCVTALIASIGGNTAAVRVAWSHVLLNVVGVIVFIPFIGILAILTTMITKDPSTQVAHAQTIFNVICSLAILPFAAYFSKFIEFLIPQRKS